MKLKVFIILFWLPNLMSAQKIEDKDTQIILADNLEYYGLKPSNYPPRQLLGYDFYNFALIWKHDLSQKEPLYALPSASGKYFYLKNEFSDIKKGKTSINVQLALDGFDLIKGDTSFLVNPASDTENHKNRKISDLFRDILNRLVTAGPEKDNQSIYLSILSGSDLNDYGLLDNNEFKLTSYYIYFIWNNTDSYRLPFQFEKASHVLLYGKDRPIYYQEKMPNETVENNKPETKITNIEQEKDDSLNTEGTAKPIIKPNNIDELAISYNSEDGITESKPEISNTEKNKEIVQNFFQSNFQEIEEFSDWKATDSGKIAFFGCTVPLPSDQELIDVQKLEFDLFVEAKKKLPAFDSLSDVRLLKNDLSDFYNTGEKHTNNNHITQKLKDLFNTHLGLKKPEMQVSVSDDEKIITINNLNGYLNGMHCSLSPIDVPLKYVDYFILAEFDSTVIYDNVSIELADVMNNVSFQTNTGLELQINESNKSITFPPLLYGTPNGIEINDNNDLNDFYTTGYSVKNNYITIYYSIDQCFTVMVVYPHFFQNKRTLTRMIDEKMKKMKEQNGKYLIYLASEFNSKIFKTEDDREVILQTIAQMYGNLIPSFTSDYQQLLTASGNYLNKLNNSKYLVSAEYSFFVPSQFWPEFREKFLGDIDVNNQGNMIIPKSFVENSLPQTSINLYFPEGSTHVKPGKINNYQCNVSEI